LVVSGQVFSVSGAGDLPITVGAGGTYNLSVNFTPTGTGTATGQLTVTGNSVGSAANTVSVSLSGIGAGTTSSAPSLSALSCTNGSITGAGADSCTVGLSAAAPAGGLIVTLGSNNGAVSVPATVTVAAGTTSASFTATVAAVGSSQTVTLSANANGVSQTFALQLNALTSALSVSSTSLVFGNEAVGSAAAQTLILSSTGTAAVTVNSATVSGTGFTVSGVTFPLTLNPNQTATLTVQFDPTAAGPASGTLTLTSNSSAGTTAVVDLSGSGVPVLTGLSCAVGSMTGAGTDSCTVTLNAAATSGGIAVNLASNNTAVTVPASVTVASGSNSATFTATVTAVSTAQTATLTASAGGVAQTFALQLSAATTGLTVNATTINFGDIAVSSSATQTVTLSVSGALAITVNSATVSGTGFSLSGGTFPLILASGQTATLQVVFQPLTADAATGTLTIISTSPTNPTDVVSLTGTGEASAYEVNLTWDAPASSPDPVASYNVYRAPSGSTSYQQINTSTVKQTAYTDTSVQNGQTYDYIVESVDASGDTSVPSNMAAVAIP
jgi:hypothetical protein